MRSYLQNTLNLRNYSTIIQGLFVFAAFMFFAELGRILVIPPGQASVIWPAAGLSVAAVYVLGYRMAFAVFLGALINSLRYYDNIGLNEVSISMSIAFGTALQACLATYCIKTIYAKRTLLGNLKDTCAFMLITGPISSVISASIATFTLLQFGIIETDQFWPHAFSWWLGDVFGVVVFGPLCVIAFSQTTDKNSLSLKRRLIVGLPMLASIALFVFLFHIFTDNIEHRAWVQNAKTAQQITTDLQQKITIDTSHVLAVAAFFDASEHVSDKEFAAFTSPLLDDMLGLYGLSWIPKISHAERENFERFIQAEGYENFEIRSHTNNNLERSSVQDVYFPISYVRPYEQNKMAHGFDVYNISNEHGLKRRKILDTARDTGRPMATSRFPIIQQQDQYGFIIYFPLYNKRNLTTVDDRRKHHIGYINGIFTIPNLVHSLVQKAKEHQSHFILKEIQDDGTPPLILYDSRTADGKESPQYNYDFTSISHHQATIEVAGKTWQTSIFPINQIPTIESTKTLWFYVLWGIVFNVFLMIVLTLITARNDYIENLVKERTSDLRQANEELEEFAYRTSHDLRSPLLSCIKLIDLAAKYINEGKTDQAVQAMSISTSSLKKQEQLINDIFSLTETKNMEEEKKIVNMDILIMESLEKINHIDGFQDVKIIKDLSYNDYLFVKRSRIQSIVENLISNAIKYQDKSKTKPYVKITTKSENNYFVFSVQDNGLGIPVQSQKDLFTMFKRFHPKVSVGSGLGLYMIKKSAKILKGEIHYEDTGNGSHFTLRIPIENTYQDT